MLISELLLIRILPMQLMTMGQHDRTLLWIESENIDGLCIFYIRFVSNNIFIFVSMIPNIILCICLALFLSITDKERSPTALKQIRQEKAENMRPLSLPRSFLPCILHKIPITHILDPFSYVKNVPTLGKSSNRDQNLISSKDDNDTLACHIPSIRSPNFIASSVTRRQDLG